MMKSLKDILVKKQSVIQNVVPDILHAPRKMATGIGDKNALINETPINKLILLNPKTSMIRKSKYHPLKKKLALL